MEKYIDKVTCDKHVNMHSEKGDCVNPQFVKRVSVNPHRHNIDEEELEPYMCPVCEYDWCIEVNGHWYNKEYAPK
jgi:hypothetical protein